MTAPATHPRAGDGIAIRPCGADDVDALFAVVSASQASLAQWLPWAKATYTREDARTWIAQCESSWHSGDGYHFGVFGADTGELLGAVGLRRHRERSSANLGYWVSDAAQGRGIAVAASRLAVAFGFDELGLVRIEILTLPGNARSLRVATKLGALSEGVARDGLIVDGVAQDVMVHALVPRDLAAGDPTGN